MSSTRSVAWRERWLRRLMAGGALSLGVACMTPMKSSEIERLTTCKGIDLAKIRKNLLLAGYEIKNASEVDLTTDFKQIGGYGRNRQLQRISVVKLDDTTWRFRVQNKEIRVDREDRGALAVGDERRKGGTVVIDLSQPVETVNEYPTEYVEERREAYLTTQAEVCGRAG